ncbi:hypothetical protein GGI42DRAFT_251203 [Trichoderma sp. SZMC 28013]
MRPNRTTGPGAVSTVNLRPALHSKIRSVKLPGQASIRSLGRASRREPGPQAQTEHARYQDEEEKEGKGTRTSTGGDRRRRKLVWSSPYRWRRGRRRDVLCTANKLQPGAHLSIGQSYLASLNGQMVQ